MEKVTLLVPSRDGRCRRSAAVHNLMAWASQVHHDVLPDLYRTLEAQPSVSDDRRHYSAGRCGRLPLTPTLHGGMRPPTVPIQTANLASRQSRWSMMCWCWELDWSYTHYLLCSDRFCSGPAVPRCSARHHLRSDVKQAMYRYRRSAKF